MGCVRMGSGVLGFMAAAWQAVQQGVRAVQCRSLLQLCVCIMAPCMHVLQAG